MVLQKYLKKLKNIEVSLKKDLTNVIHLLYNEIGKKKD